MAEIDFITYLTTNSLEYANFLKQTGEALKSGKNNIHWKCFLSNGAEIIPEGYKCIGNKNYGSLSLSMKHGLSINKSLSKITSDYVIISDVDIALTYKDWDEVIINTLDKYSCFGSPNFQKNRESINFPNVPFFTFKKDILKKVELDFTPVLNHEKNFIEIIEIKTKQEAKIMERRIGETVRLDTGCKIPQIFKNAKLKSKCLENVNTKFKKSRLQLSNFKQKIIMEKIQLNHFLEFHYNKNIFITHIRGSHSKNFHTKTCETWRDRIKNYLKQKYNINLAEN